MIFCKRLSGIFLWVLLTIFLFTGNVWATIELPHAFFNGLMITYQDNPAGDDLVFMYTKINAVYYSDGTASTSDLIVGKDVMIQGAKRDCPDTACTSFTDATLSISGGGITYFTATLSDITFTTDGAQWFLNPALDVNNAETLNMSNIELYPNGSAYIQNLMDTLGTKDIAGMQMRLFNLVGLLTGNSTNVILEGLLDGVQATTNTPPVADAGENINISSVTVAETIITGTATDSDLGDVLTCSWSYYDEINNVIVPLSESSTDCSFDLGTLEFGIGTYTLTLEVSDGTDTSSDSMFLSIENTAPNAGAGGGGIYEISDDVVLTGDVSDYDGDTVSYRWLEGDTLLCSGNVNTIIEGDPVIIPQDCVVSGMGLGVHEIILEVSDGINNPVNSEIVSVAVVDTTVPKIAPVASNYLLWPPNHVMIDVAVAANATDNSGIPVTLSVSVMSNEPQDGLDDDDIGPDIEGVTVDQAAGLIYLQLRRERAGTGDGRIYTISIIATDSSDNSSAAKVEIKVPHDMSRKK